MAKSTTLITTLNPAPESRKAFVAFRGDRPSQTVPPPKSCNALVDTTNSPPPIAFNTKNAAAYLGLKPKRLVNLRASGGGPRYRRQGNLIIYLAEDLKAWVESQPAFFNTTEEGLKSPPKRQSRWQPPQS